MSCNSRLLHWFVNLDQLSIIRQSVGFHMMLAIGRRGERCICKFVCKLIYKSCLLKF
uniref:p008-1 n=1 Tax=Homo sapiens TaxID=9606 RepID=Q5QTR9_HUMAN|nr:P008-1 [Homo sapiens]